MRLAITCWEEEIENGFINCIQRRESFSHPVEWNESFIKHSDGISEVNSSSARIEIGGGSDGCADVRMRDTSPFVRVEGGVNVMFVNVVLLNAPLTATAIAVFVEADEHSVKCAWLILKFSSSPTLMSMTAPLPSLRTEEKGHPTDDAVDISTDGALKSGAL